MIAMLRNSIGGTPVGGLALPMTQMPRHGKRHLGAGWGGGSRFEAGLAANGPFAAIGLNFAFVPTGEIRYAAHNPRQLKCIAVGCAETWGGPDGHERGRMVHGRGCIARMSAGAAELLRNRQLQFLSNSAPASDEDSLGVIHFAKYCPSVRGISLPRSAAKMTL